MREFFKCSNKKWWVILLGGVVNCLLFGFTFGTVSIFSGATPALFLLVIPIAFCLHFWLLSQVSLLRFFVTAFVLVLSFIVGYAVSFDIFDFMKELIFPGQEALVTGSDFSAFITMLFLFLYVFAGIASWIAGLIRTILAWQNARKEKVSYKNPFEKINHT